MKFKVLNMLLMAFIMTCSSLAHAGLIDHGEYTTDDVTGLEWLDWTATVNMTSTEATNVYAEYRLATHDELVSLFSNTFGGALIFDPQGYSQTPTSAGRTPQGVMFRDLFGRTMGPNTYVTLEGHGLYGFDSYVYAGFLQDTYGVALYRSDRMGVAMVANEVPEPSTLAIFALGMIGLASRRFKKQS